MRTGNRLTRPKDNVDETFLSECLTEVRDGEAVTIQTSWAEEDVRRALSKLGATDVELERITIERAR